MPEATLIQEFNPSHVPAPLEPQEKAVLDAYYEKYAVKNGTVKEKIHVLMKAIQERSFFALGGDESEEIELRANERIFLVQMNGK